MASTQAWRRTQSSRIPGSDYRLRMDDAAGAIFRELLLEAPPPAEEGEEHAETRSMLLGVGSLMGT